ncbi:MAG: zinc ABC transporter substrate-binding protein [Rhizonema sp. NSF051]|nr:zinc ABC transporter substrate-binding protein [Rhizonema sp. NSF051]
MSKKLSLTKPMYAALVALSTGLFGCNNLGNVANTSTTTVTSAGLNNHLPRVVATTSILCDLTKQVAAETINLTCLIPPDANPQLYHPKLEDRKAIENAQLIFFNEYNVEPNVFKLIKASKNRIPKIAVNKRAVSVEPQSPNHYIWHNTKYGSKMVDVINNYLSKLSPENTSLYNNNSRKVKNELTRLDAWIKSRIASIPADQRKLVTTDYAMDYYAKAYGLSYVGVSESISNKEKPTAAQVSALVRDIRKDSVPTIFPENTSNLNLIKAIAKEAKVNVSKRELLVNNLGAPGSEEDTYQKMMVANTRTIVEGLGGTYLIFEPQALKSSKL